MSIIVFWLAPEDETPSPSAQGGKPAARRFDSGALAEALAYCENLRKAGMRHVTISSEPDESVTLPGVNDVLPAGYDWKKRRE